MGRHIVRRLLHIAITTGGAYAAITAIRQGNDWPGAFFTIATLTNATSIGVSMQQESRDARP